LQGTAGQPRGELRSPFPCNLCGAAAEAGLNDSDGTLAGSLLSDPLNLEALYAILGASADREAALVKLLLSDRPIHPLVRSALAAALQGGGQFGCKLEFANATDDAKRLQRQAKGAELRKTYVKIGDWIASAQEKDGLGYNEAVEAAATKFMVGDKKCQASYTYRNEFRDWLSKNFVPGTVYGRMDLETLSNEYHDKRACGRQMPRNRTLAEERQETMRLAEKYNVGMTPAELTTLFEDEPE